MDKIAWTQAQRAIIEQVEGQITVTASAGSGKTAVLAERYLKLVQSHGVSPSQILAITFTRAAAAELKRRIVDRLYRVGNEEAAQEAETGPIQTIHSFAERILRENAIAIGLDPTFKVVSPSESSRVVARAVKRAIQECSQDDEECSMFVKVCVGKTHFGMRSSYNVLETAVEKALDAFRASGIARSVLSERFLDGPTYGAFADRTLRGLVPAVVWESVESVPPDSSWQKEAWPVVKKLPDDLLKKSLSWVNNSVNATVDSTHNALAAGLAKIALEAYVSLEAELSMKNELDFSRCISKAVSMLQNFSEVRTRLGEQYLHVMVDEAQDVDPLQYELFESFAGRSLMLVGDEKQSIYAFRNADVQLFKQKTHGSRFSLDQNHRSTLGIQQFVDEVFGAKFKESYRPMISGTPFSLDDETEVPDFAGVEYWKLLNDSDDSQLATFIQEEIAAGQLAPRDTAILVQTANRGLEVERALLKKGIRCKHNLLSRRYYGCTEIQDLTSTLLALSNSQDGYSHLAMLRSPVVGLSLDGIVEFSASPGSLQERLATFAPSVADDAEKLVAMRKWYWELSGKVDRLSAWEVLELIFNRTPFLDSIAKLTNPIQRLENVRKLLMLAAQEPMLSATEFAHYIQEVSYASKESEAPTFDQSDDLVSISTIHAAKGLEWPVVFLADIDKNRKNTIKEPVFDAKTGLFSPILDGYKGWSHFYLHQKEGQKLAEEELRKMYVALTRAKRRLVLVARAAKASEFFRHIESVLGERLGAMTTRDTDPDRDTKWPHDE